MKAKAKPKAKKAAAPKLDAHRAAQVKLQEAFFQAKLASICQFADAIKRVKVGKGDFVLLDARDSASFSDGHIPGAASVPAGDIRRIEALDKSKSYVTYCWNGT